MDLRDFISSNKEKILIEKIGVSRFNHSIEVAKTAELLANIYDISEKDAFIAGLFHDCAKYKDKKEYLDLFDKYKHGFDYDPLADKSLYHGHLGKIIAKKEYGINEPNILNAIKNHTMLRESPSKLEKIIFLADATEATRKYDGVENLRKLSLEDLDKACLLALNETINSLIERELYIGLDTIKARNYFLQELRR